MMSVIAPSAARLAVNTAPINATLTPVAATQNNRRACETARIETRGEIVMSTETKPATEGETAVDKQWLLSIGGRIERDGEREFDWIAFGTSESIQVRFVVDDEEPYWPDLWSFGSEDTMLPWVETRDQLRGLFKALETAPGFKGLHLK
jgi:hypothetical protein